MATRNTLIIAIDLDHCGNPGGHVGGPGDASLSFLRATRRRKPLMYLPIVIPEVVMGISLLVLFVLMNLKLGLVTITLSHIAFNIPFVALVVRARLHGYDNAIDEAAMDLGADELTTFWRVTLPTIMPGVLVRGHAALSRSPWMTM